MRSRASAAGTPEVGTPVWTQGFGVEPTRDRAQRRAGVIIYDCGAQYTDVRGPDGKPLVRRWAVRLEDGVLVFRHPADLEMDNPAAPPTGRHVNEPPIAA